VLGMCGLYPVTRGRVMIPLLLRDILLPGQVRRLFSTSGLGSQSSPPCDTACGDCPVPYLNSPEPSSRHLGPSYLFQWHLKRNCCGEPSLLDCAPRSSSCRSKLPDRFDINQDPSTRTPVSPGSEMSFVPPLTSSFTYAGGPNTSPPSTQT